MKGLFLKLLLITLYGIVFSTSGSGLQANTNNKFGSNDSNQQNSVEVKGIVVDSKGEPLVGVTVKLKGKPVGIHTGIDGDFSLYVPIGTTIEFTYLGMKPTALVVKNNKSLTIQLENDSKELSEVVITGFGQTTARRTAGSVATVNVSELTKDSPLKNVDQLLQGQVAGVNVSAISGRPGESAKIRIRGISTITGNADPLWVVDGIPLAKGFASPNAKQIKSGDFSTLYQDGIAGINPRDIENITILKDASATAIYGSQGSNGVIVVTTKRGQAGKMRVNFSTNLVMQTKPQRNANLMNSKEKLAFEQELWDEFSATKFANGDKYPVVGIVGAIRSGYNQYKGLSLEAQNELINELGKHSTNWFDALFRSSLSQSHNISLSGGTEKNTYYVSMGYTGNTGIVKKTDSEGYTANLKLNTKFNEKLTLEFDTDFSHLLAGGSAGSVDPFKFAYFANPYEHPYNEDGSYSSNDTYKNLSYLNNNRDAILPPNGYNIMRDIDGTSSETTSTTVAVRSQISYKLSDDLKISGLAKFSYTSNNSDNIVGKETYTAWTDRPFDLSYNGSTRTYGSITQASMSQSNLVARAQLSYNKHLGGFHRISMIGGSEISRNYSKNIYLKRYGYDPLTGNSSIPLYPDPGTGKIDYNQFIAYGALVDGLSGQSVVEDRLASFYFAADYNLYEKYILSTSLRTDGSSNFGSKQQFNPTGSIGFAWNADQESFIKALKPILSSLTLRASTGYTGNINRSVYPQLMMNYGSTFRKTNDDYFRMGIIENAPNKNLRWEKTFDYKISVDAGFLNDRIRLLTEAYVRNTKDAVSSLTVTSTTGFPDQKYNNSEVQNKGIEFTLSSTLLELKDFRWNMTANIGYNVNKLTKLFSINGTIPEKSGNLVNYPLNGIYGGKLIGIDPNTGIYKFALRPDANAITDSELRDFTNYLFYLGTSNAPINGGFSMNFSYKDLSLNIGGAYSINGKVYNNISAPEGYSAVNRNASSPQGNLGSLSKYDLYTYHFNTTRDAVNRWRVDNPITSGNPRIIDMWDTETPIFENDNPINSMIMTGALLENVSYLKLTNLSMSYAVPKTLYKKWGIDAVSVVFSMNNLFTFTNYSGIDPETPGAVYPQSRSFSFGLSVSL